MPSWPGWRGTGGPVAPADATTPTAREVTPSGIAECVANVSEGRSESVLEALAATCGPALLDLHRDPDHHRSVFTLAASLDELEASAGRLAAECVARIDLREHDGVHPRLGALDVAPFVALDPADLPMAAEAARRFAQWVGDALEVPAFLYDAADPEGRSLPEVRHEAFATRPPDTGPRQPHVTAGAVAVGARRVLVAVNCDLGSDDLEQARAVARAVRGSSGGLPGVRALGFYLASERRTQVSMNLIDLHATGLEAACAAVRAEARRAGTELARVELVGLLPGEELTRCSEGFLASSSIDASMTIEARLAARDRAL